MFNTHLGSIRPIIAQTISKLALPKLPTVHNNLWLTHASYHGALTHAFESPKGIEPRDYERLEVCQVL